MSDDTNRHEPSGLLPEGFTADMIVTEGDAIVHETTQESVHLAIVVSPEAFSLSDVLGPEYEGQYVRTWHIQTFDPRNGEEGLAHIPYSEDTVLLDRASSIVMRAVASWLEDHGLSLPTSQEVMNEQLAKLFGVDPGQLGEEPPF